MTAFTIVAIAAALLGGASAAHAQEREFAIRGFGDVGSTTFTAAESFKAILGTDRGTTFGGGVEAVLPARVFIALRASRFRDTGERVFVFNDEVFRLGIPATITVTPLELTGGYRLDFGGRVIPYGGGGIGWHQYEESSDFADDSENVKERFTGYQLLGGVEFRIARWLGAAGELQWATVQDALGQDENGVSSHFGEDDLGGMSFRLKVVIGR